MIGRQSPPARRARAGRTFSVSNRWTPTILLAPSIIGLLVLTLYPLIDAVRLSLVNYDLLSATANGRWTGLQNYISLFENPDFWSALWVTLTYTVAAVALELVIGFALALLLNQPIPGRSIARTLIVSAMVMAPIVVGTAWRLMYNPSGGIFNYLLGLIGIQPQDFLGQANYVIPSLVVTDVWEWSPLVMLIILAGLQSLSVEVYEAARVDGANVLQTFLRLTLPLLKPAIAVALLFRTIDCLRTFDIIFAMTGGGPGTASQSLTILAYNTGLEFYHISSASAIGMVMLVLITVIAMVMMRLFGANLWRSRP